MMLRKVFESPSLKMFNKLVVVALREMVRGEHGSAVLTVILMTLEFFPVLTIPCFNTKSFKEDVCNTYSWDMLSRKPSHKI